MLQTARPWKANEAELRRYLTGLLLLTEQQALDKETVSQRLGLSGDAPLPDEFAKIMDLPMKDAEKSFQRIYLTVALKRFNYNKTKVAEFCDCNRTTIHHLIGTLKTPTKPETQHNG
ncbi:MAG: hypothetical protein D4R70_00720 [Betaproteobacteria bacterium]|nr:MAG: hypothetical protein D4R70_00720 [Betaproteobacteria bacterium]